MKALALALGLTLAQLTAANALAQHKPHHGPMLTVVGQAEVAGTPDSVELTAGVMTSDVKAARALEQNSRVVAALHEVLEEYGVEKRRVQTTHFDVAPEYDRTSGDEAPRVAGYRVSHLLSIRYGDIARAGALLDALIGAGSNQLHQVRFFVAEPGPLLDEARALAVADAFGKARTLAEAAGLALGPVKRIVEGAGDRPHPVADGMMEMRAMAAAPIAAGEQSFSAAVTVVFELLEP